MAKVLRPGPHDWLSLSSDPEYARWMYEARQRFARIERGTIQQIREAYREAGQQIGNELRRLEITSAERYQRRVQWYLDAGYPLHRALEAAGPSLSDASWRAAQAAVDDGLRGLSDRTLREVSAGVRSTVGAAFLPARRIMESVLSEHVGQAQVRSAVRMMNDRALLGLVNRLGPDGLRVSDRVWRVEQHVRRKLTTVIQAGVADGLDPRKLARRVEGFLGPGVGRPLRPETRRRLRVPRDVSMEAMRLAVTEQQHAWHEASIQADRSAPGYLGIYWRVSQTAHLVRDVCDDLAEHNGDGFWPAGSEPVKPHPWCRCVAVPRMADREETVERLRRWIRDPSSEPALERWYESVREFLPRPAA